MNDLSIEMHFNIKYNKNPFEELKNKCLIKENSRGLVSIGSLEKLKSFFAKKFFEIATKYDAIKQDYSCFLQKDFLDKIDFKCRFPQALFTIKDFEDKTTNLDLSPAECFHTFDFYENQDLKSTKVITCSGRCFRNEPGQTFERTKDFTMQEIVFIGSKEFVLAKRIESLNDVLELVKKLKLDVTVEKETDLFFLNLEKTYAFEKYDLKTDSKYELRALLPYDNKRLAISSFNVHGTFFGDKLNITFNRKPIYSGCTAFGLERWVYAFVSQYGLDPKNWPEIIKEEVNEL